MRSNDVIGLIDQQMMLEDYWRKIAQTHNIKKNRERRNVIYRQAFFVAARQFSNLSLNAIGNILNKNHATVLHAHKCHEMNYKYDKIYRTTFDSMAYAITKMVDAHTENIEQLVAERLSKINVDVYENSLIDMYKRKLEKTEERYEELLGSVKRDLAVVTKQMKHHKRRAEKLNKECLRLKNLL